MIERWGILLILYAYKLYLICDLEYITINGKDNN